MATNEERMRILNMIREGKITAEEGAKLLEALGEAQKATRVPGSRTPLTRSGDPGWFRVRVTDMMTGRVKTTVNIPLSLMEWGMQIGAHFAPEVADLNMEQVMTSLRSGVEGKIVDVMDEEDGEHVEIFIE
jgi:hypothetical protein